MDELDQALLRMLIEDARQSMRRLSERLHVAPGTVATRLNRLETEGVIQGYVPRFDAAAVGWEFTIAVGLRISKGRLLEVQNRIAEDHRVIAVYDVTGEVDSLVIARMQDREDLDDFTKTALSSDGIERSNTHVVLNIVKEDHTSLPSSVRNF